MIIPRDYHCKFYSQCEKIDLQSIFSFLLGVDTRLQASFGYEMDLGNNGLGKQLTLESQVKL